MTAATETTVEAPPAERLRPEGQVEGWRFDELFRHGWDPSRAELIAKRLDIDLHYACDLVKVKGCDPDTAAKILL